MSSDSPIKHQYGITCVVIDSDKNLLLLKRSPDKKLFPNQWAVVGAAPLSENENMKAMAEREIQDELGVSGRILKTGPIISALVDGYQWHIATFLAQIDSKDITLNYEHTEYKWITIDELNQYNLPPLMFKAIKDLLNN